MNDNAKAVYLILLEFLKIYKIRTIPPTGYRINDVFQAIILAEIAEEFLLDTEFKALKIFDAVADAYSQDCGQDNFLIYRKVLEKTKKNEFKELMLILEKRKQFRLNIQKALQ